MRKVAFITNIVPDYRCPIFELLAATLDRDEFRIFVTVPLEQSCRQARERLPLHYSLTYQFWFTTHHRGSGGEQREPIPIPLALFKDLLAYRPDVVVAGEFGLRSLVCWIGARLLRAKFVLWSEEIGSSANGRSALQRWLRRFLTRRADAYLAWGEPARAYLTGLGAQSQQIFSCVQAVDNDFWLEKARTLNRDAERRALQLEGTVFLLVGRLLPRKGFQNFLTVWSRMPASIHAGVTAVIVGSGSYLQPLEELARQASLSNVRFVGTQTPDELARFYVAADVFVFPSLEDVWGLVVNEAMCFGLPILASRFAGSSQELVRPDVGIVFNPADIEEFADRITSWAAKPPARATRICEEIILPFNFSAAANAIGSMLATVCRRQQ